MAATGCSTLGVRVDSRAEKLQARETESVLSQSKGSPAATALAGATSPKLSKEARAQQLLSAARLAWNAKDVALYNAAVGELVIECSASDFQKLPAGLRLATSGSAVFNPTRAGTLVPADAVSIKGLISRTTQDGVGVPYVAWVPKDSPAVAGQPGIPKAGMAFPVTAVVTFKGNVAELRFQETLQSDQFVFNGRKQQLAADFSAPIAVLLSHGKNRSIDFDALIFTKRNFANIGLVQFQPYDPKKIPVVFVHGLVSRPEAWTQALNGLLADPKVREKYQFWFYLYPTGLPVWKSAAVLRTELDRFHKTLDPSGRNPNLNKMVMIGHSMGGLITSLMIREGGDKLWKQFSDVPSDELKLSPEAKKSVLELVYFAPRKDIDRVIFVATPHRGSNLALNPVANFGASLIKLPFALVGSDRSEIVRAMRDDVKSLFVAPANSVRFLRAKSPLLLSILNLPLSPDIPYHSIIGDRGKGNTPNSSDGVVPYWSSHLDGAQSEKVVPSGHGANENAQGVEEMRRILVLNLGK
jgi:triacylglycerol esterase/lipase EstA (alpha/beta hydrolase family)